MFKRFIIMIGLMIMLAGIGCDAAIAQDEGTETLPFQLRVGKVYVAGQENILSSLQVRFYTKIFHPNLGVAVGLAAGSEDKIYLADISYQLVPDTFDFVIGIAGIDKKDEQGIDLRFNFGMEFNVGVFKRILQWITGGGLL